MAGQLRSFARLVDDDGYGLDTSAVDLITVEDLMEILDNCPTVEVPILSDSDLHLLSRNGSELT